MPDIFFTPDDVAWDANPPEDDSRFIPIFSAHPDYTGRLVVISDHVEGVQTHWVGMRTVPCQGKESCENCALKRSCKWKGYLGCWDDTHSRLCMLEITPEGARNCTFPLLDKKVSMRGLLVKYWRIGKAMNAPMRLEILKPTEDIKKLPEPFDVRSALCRLWNGQTKPK